MRRLRCATNSDGISITLAPLGLWVPGRMAARGMLSAGAAVALARWDAPVPACILGLYALLQIVSYLVSAGLQHELTVIDGSLTICSFFHKARRNKKKAWERGQVVAVNSRIGLWVFTSVGEQRFLRGREKCEIDQVASLLRDALNVCEEITPGPSELAVRFRGPFWSAETPGVLASRAGELTLRSPLMRDPFFYFCSRSAPQASRLYMADVNVIFLSPHEIVGRTPEGAAGRVVIAPTTFMLLRRNFIIPPGIAGQRWRTIFFWMRLEFQIYCEDAARLQAALGVFWQTST